MKGVAYAAHESIVPAVDSEQLVLVLAVDGSLMFDPRTIGSSPL